MIKKIVSGGQTGVDRAALDVAMKFNIPEGGWCPKGRRAEDGIIPHRYQLRETSSEDYSERTTLNVHDSDGTLIIVQGEPSGGTLLTINEAVRLKKPCLVFNLDKDQKLYLIFDWIQEKKIEILNVAGPRESKKPGIYQSAYKLLEQILS
jgi:hypothetical protein